MVNSVYCHIIPTLKQPSKKKTMRKFFIPSLLLICLTGNTFAQKSSYGISGGIGKGAVLRKALEGSASHELGTGYSAGIYYSKRLVNKLHLVTGLNAYRSQLTVTPTFHPNTDLSPKSYDMRLLYVPVFLKVDLSRYFFINAGLIGDLDITKDKQITDQTGMGAGLGIGGEIPFCKKFAIQINPYTNFHGLLLTKSGNYPLRVADVGVKLNLILKR
jgi:hypothetical protein